MNNNFSGRSRSKPKSKSRPRTKSRFTFAKKTKNIKKSIGEKISDWYQEEMGATTKKKKSKSSPSSKSKTKSRFSFAKKSKKSIGEKVSDWYQLEMGEKTKKSKSKSSAKNTIKSLGVKVSDWYQEEMGKTTKNSKKLTPRVFLILGHSFECHIDKLSDEIANYNILKILKKKISEPKSKSKSKSKDDPDYIKQVNRDYKTLLNGDKVKCHKHTTKEATIFCSSCFYNGDKPYFWCEKCEKDNYANNKGSKPYTVIPLKYRIDLNNDFKKEYPTNKIRFMVGQSSGRGGLTTTSFDIISFMQNSPEFRELIYSAKDMKDMKHLDKVLNNIEWQNVHGDNIDTNFSIYPRKNNSGKFIVGPKNNLNSFFPSSQSKSENIFLNGYSWPLGIYELPIFNINDHREYINNYKINILFRQNGLNKKSNPEWDFFSLIKTNNPFKAFKRALLLNLKLPKNKSTATTEETLLMNGLPELNRIAKYNKLLYNEVQWDLFNASQNRKSNFLGPFNKPLTLKKIIKLILDNADIKPNEEIIFISNACRNIYHKDIQLYHKLNQTMDRTPSKLPAPDYIKNSIQILRNNSRE